MTSTGNVTSIRHKDKRANIPTEELRDFVADDEGAPATMLYPRDPSLDPQLVWKGKDDQDRADLAVPVVPVYIQEKIEPRAIIDGLVHSTPPPELPVNSISSQPSMGRTRTTSIRSSTSTGTRTPGRTGSSSATRCW